MTDLKRLGHWETLESKATDLLMAMEQCASCEAWRDTDITRWDAVHEALQSRPRLSVVERDRLSGYFESKEGQGDG